MNLSKGFIKILCGLIAALSFSSCVNETQEDELTASQDVQLILRLGVVGTREEPWASRDLQETVKSVRIILIDKAGRVEVNELMALGGSEYVAGTFQATFNRMIKSGTKKFYLIANEESVTAPLFTSTAGFPADMPKTSLTAVLDYFPAETEDNGGAPTGSLLETVVNRLYFKTDYSGMTEGNKIYLPYSAYYTFDVKNHSKVQKDMFLVPAATKFDFTFVNYRRENAQIDDIILSSVNSHNFLYAQLDGEELYRQLDEETVWWIDWLQACASGSQTADDNTAFNTAWGWIKKYKLPLNDETPVDVALNTRKEAWVVDALTNLLEPPELKLGPFYMAESINIAPATVAGDDTADSQRYTLTFYVHDELSDEVTTLAGYEINTLQSLFRATHVKLKILLYEREVEIFAEIAPWEDRLFLGFVQQDPYYEE